MAAGKVMILLVALLVGMTITCVCGDSNKKASHGNPLWEEFSNQGGGSASGNLDHTDIFNFDPVSRTMRNKNGKGDRIDLTFLEECQMELIQCRQNLADFHEKTLIDAMYDTSDAHDAVKTCKKGLKTCQDDLTDCELGCQVKSSGPADDSTESPCKLEQMFFRRFAKHFINLLISEDKEQDGSPLEADVRVELSPHGWSKLRQFVQQKGKVKLIDAHDLMSDMLISVHHDNSTGDSSWLERVTGMDITDIKFYALLCALSILVIVFESRTRASWWQQLCAVMFVLFMISVGWNWISLYKKEFASKMSRMTKFNTETPVSCMPDKMTWWDSLNEAVRKQVTFQDDPCDIYHQDILVDPIYEVPPTRAISFTIATMFLEPLKHFGKHLADFHRELFKDLPYGAWIPTLLSVYVIPIAVVFLLCYCPCRGWRGNAAWDRVHMLEEQLRERNVIDQRRGRIEELEVPRREGYMAVQQAPVPALNPGRDNRQLGNNQPGLHQRHLHQEFVGDPAPAERPQARARRRQRGSSESDLLQHRQQRQPFCRDLGGSYQGDVSGGDDESSDETDNPSGQRPCALPLEKVPGTSSQVFTPRVTTSRVAFHLRSKTTEILKQPIESPNSEIDSEKDHPAVRKAAGAKGEAQFRKEPSQGEKVRAGQIELMRDKPLEGALDQRDAAQATKPEEEVKLRKEEPISADLAQTVSATLTPASSTDSEPFLTSALGCDSPSSVSVIEGDSSPASGGSVDGDSHLQGLGTSLSGSIDIIEPLGPLEGERNPSVDGQESDEFEVLSREQCQTEDVGN